MARAPDDRPLIVLRWVFLALLLVAAGVVAWVYATRERAAAPPRPARAPSPVTDSRDRDVVLAGEGFEYEVTEGGKTLFFIRAQSMLSDRDNRFVLERVRITFESESGDQFEVVGDRATYDLETRNAGLEGSVVLSGPDGVELRGPAFDIRQEGEVLASRTPPVAFRLAGGYQGTAQRVRLHRRRRLVRMAGDVTLRSPPGSELPLGLSAARMVFQRDEGMLRAEGDVRFRRGDDSLSCRRLGVTFAQGGGQVQMIQGSWDVEGRLVRPAGFDREEVLSFSARRFAVLYDANGETAREAEIEGSPAAPTELRIEDGAGQRRALRSQRLQLTFADGAVSELRSFVPVVLEEGLARAGTPPARRLCGDSLAMRFAAGGGVEQLELVGQVDYQETGLTALGSRLTRGADDSLRLTGTPARLLRPSGEIEAAEIVYSGPSSSVRASGGVVALGQERAGIELAAAGGGEPVRVTAQEATWTEEPAATVFEGAVQAWQGESFLLADRLATSDGGDRLEADGSVKTHFQPQSEAAERRPPVDVNANKLVYLRQERRLRYAGSVRVHESGRTVRCQEMEMELDAERRIDRMLCRGNAVLEDPVAGRTIRGSEALYTPADRLMLISGEPAVLRDRDGASIRGRRMRYDLESGQAQVLSEPAARPEEAADAAARDDG